MILASFLMAILRNRGEYGGFLLLINLQEIPYGFAKMDSVLPWA